MLDGSLQYGVTVAQRPVEFGRKRHSNAMALEISQKKDFYRELKPDDDVVAQRSFHAALHSLLARRDPGAGAA
jgi:hypothetical protein